MSFGSRDEPLVAATPTPRAPTHRANAYASRASTGPSPWANRGAQCEETLDECWIFGILAEFAPAESRISPASWWWGGWGSNPRPTDYESPRGRPPGTKSCHLAGRIPGRGSSGATRYRCVSPCLLDGLLDGLLDFFAGGCSVNSTADGGAARSALAAHHDLCPGRRTPSTQRCRRAMPTGP